MAEFDGDRAYRILESIAHERLAGTEGERKAAETLAGHLRGTGLEPELEEFRMWTYIRWHRILLSGGRSREYRSG